MGEPAGDNMDILELVKKVIDSFMEVTKMSDVTARDIRLGKIDGCQAFGVKLARAWAIRKMKYGKKGRRE